MANKNLRKLGRTGYDVFPLALGGHTYPVGTGADDFCTYEERAELVKYLVSLGVNYFDTTFLNEVELLADSFKRAGINKDVIVSMQYVDGISDVNWRDKFRSELEVRLKIMNYDSAPLYLMGLGNHEVTYSELVAACETLAKAKAEGIIKNMGISCHRLEYFPMVSKLIREYDLLDYMMIRFNWKYQQANEELFKTAQEHNVGVVLMKAFCWDCGPNQWERRISVFEPVDGAPKDCNSSILSPAQRSYLWSLQNSPCSTAAIAMNSKWEVDQNIKVIERLTDAPDTSDFPYYSDRLWNKAELEKISTHSESGMIRSRAKHILDNSLL